MKSTWMIPNSMTDYCAWATVLVIIAFVNLIAKELFVARRAVYQETIIMGRIENLWRCIRGSNLTKCSFWWGGELLAFLPWPFPVDAQLPMEITNKETSGSGPTSSMRSTNQNNCSSGNLIHKLAFLIISPRKRWESRKSCELSSRKQGVWRHICGDHRLYFISGSPAIGFTTVELWKFHEINVVFVHDV